MTLDGLRHKSRLPAALKLRNRNIRIMIPLIMVPEKTAVFQIPTLYNTTYLLPRIIERFRMIPDKKKQPTLPDKNLAEVVS